MVTYKEIRCSSFMNRMDESLFTVRTYSIRLSGNPYSGCAHDCAWCYAAYIHKFNTRYDPSVTPRDFGKKVFVKVNAPEVLRRELDEGLNGRKKSSKEFCDVSTITDSYQPCERKYRIMRQCLEVFLEYEFPVTTLTRSHLILDDLSVWRKLAAKGIGVVGMSVTKPTILESAKKNFLEPKSPSTESILNALKELNSNGVPTFAFIDPVVPFFTDDEESISQLFREVASTGTKNIFFGVMKLNSLSWGLFRERLREHYPNLVGEFERVYIKEGEKEFNRSYQPSFSYRQELYTRARAIARKLNLGFSCEGGFYELWLNDWADVENPFRHPTGYNLWRVLQEKNGRPVTLDQMKNKITSEFSLVSPLYLAMLSKLWVDGTLFQGLNDVNSLVVKGERAYSWAKGG